MLSEFAIIRKYVAKGNNITLNLYHVPISLHFYKLMVDHSLVYEYEQSSRKLLNAIATDEKSHNV